MALEAYDTIFQQFPAASAEDWKNKIIKDLKGESFDKLIWHTKEGIEVLPFYTKESVKNKVLYIPEKSIQGWQIAERVVVEEPAKANAAALNALQNGAQVMVFDLQHQSIVAETIQLLVKDIQTEIAPVFFENYQAENRTLLNTLLPGACPAAIRVPQLDTLTEELVYALHQTVHCSEHEVQVHFLIGQNYFFEIARLRAFRWLWKQVTALQQRTGNLTILCETSKEHFEVEDENSNILRNTTAAMSAILGSCDMLLVNSHDALKSETAFGKRIARNVQHILHFESYFNELQDAAKGSYYIEYLTYELAKNAWEQFRKTQQ
jgi:methylmalonyl-CoA mutase